MKPYFSPINDTQNNPQKNYSNAGQKPAEGWFLSKWVYNFLPAQNLTHLSHHIGGGQLPKNMLEIL